MLIQPNDVQISLCMIVRDNERTIAAALRSIKPFVDEMIVVDTGSEDRTPEIAAWAPTYIFNSSKCIAIFHPEGSRNATPSRRTNG